MRLQVCGLCLVATITGSGAAYGFDPTFLSISEARHYIQTADARIIGGVDPGFERNSVSGCYRVSRGAVDCRVTDYYEDGSRCVKRIKAYLTPRRSIRFKWTSRLVCS
jgi:hypothetical protein